MIMPDENTNDETFNPREDSNLGIMVCFHKRYSLGDSVTHPYAGNIVMEDAVKIEATSTCPVIFNDQKWEPSLVMPLYLYDHSGIAISTGSFSCPWDSGKIGIIYAPYSKIKKWFGWSRMTKKRVELVRKSLLCEVEEYDKFIRG